jgi:hypothetical protein
MLKTKATDYDNLKSNKKLIKSNESTWDILPTFGSKHILTSKCL